MDIVSLVPVIGSGFVGSLLTLFVQHILNTRRAQRDDVRPLDGHRRAAVRRYVGGIEDARHFPLDAGRESFEEKRLRLASLAIISAGIETARAVAELGDRQLLELWREWESEGLESVAVVQDGRASVRDVMNADNQLEAFVRRFDARVRKLELTG